MPDYPTTVSKLPAQINRHTVLAWVSLTRHNGEYPGGIVLAHNPDEAQPYVTWTVYTQDGGETWSACWGHSWHEYEAAWEDFIQRPGSKAATS